jgi:hypothetical protein
MTIRTTIAAAASALAMFALGGCAYDDFGYGGVNAGYGYQADPYYAAGPYGGAGLGYVGAEFGGGWYNDFYYPGTGVYVIDRGGRRHRWNDSQRRHWQGNGNVRPGRPGGQNLGRPGQGRPQGIGQGRPGRGDGPRGQNAGAPRPERSQGIGQRGPGRQGFSNPGGGRQGAPGGGFRGGRGGGRPAPQQNR